MVGLTQMELAERADLGTAYVNQLLTGEKTNPSLEVLDKLAGVFGVATAVLIDGRLDDIALRTELAKASLREASKLGLPHHPKFARYIETDLAPTTVEGWQRLRRILEIAEGRRHRTPSRRRAATRGT